MKRPAAAFALGLPAALFAHALVFGGEHSAGGALGSAALGAGILAALCGAAVFAANAVQGSIVARRVRVATPSLAVLAFASCAWFAALESCESPHHVVLAAVLAAIAASCVLVRALIGVFAEVIATVVITIVRSLRTCVARQCASIPGIFAPRPRFALAHTGRRFSRPPPHFS